MFFLDVGVDNNPETAEPSGEKMETLKFSFNVNSLGLVLFGGHSQKVCVCRSPLLCL